MVNNSIKVELGETALRDIVLNLYFPEVNKDAFEAYFYLAEDGSPTFVVEQKTT